MNVVRPPGGALDPHGAPEPSLEGDLVRGSERHAVTIACASRTALRVAFAGAAPADGAVFDGLVVRTARGELDLTRCRFDASANASAFGGRLVFLDDVYDVRTLLFDQEVAAVRSALESIPMVLGKREGLRPEFRDLVADVTYDLSVFRKFYDEQERLLAHEPPDVAELARQAIVRSEQGRFFAFMDRHLDDLAAVVKGYTRDEHERHGFYLRRQAWPYIAASAFLHRTNTKPRGYAGDAEMMQIIYDNAYVGATVFERLMHKHPVEHPSAQAVRNRRKLIPQVLREVLGPMAARGEVMKFLSVAAGPACELHDIFRSPGDAALLHCTLLDQDPFALSSARENLARIERDLGRNVEVELIQESVRTMLRPHAADRFGRYHFIYSMGLFDYLTPPVARAVLAKLYTLLEPGGRILVGNYHVDSASRVYMDYWLDWVLYYRTEPAFLALTEGLPGASACVTFDDSRCQMFLDVEKRGEAP